MAKKTKASPKPKKKTAAKVKASTAKAKAGKTSSAGTSRKKTSAKKAAVTAAIDPAAAKVAKKKVAKQASVETNAAVDSPKPSADEVRARKKARKAAAAGGKVRSGGKSAAAERKSPKTRLNAKQLAMFKELLLEKRRELLGDVRTLTNDALGRSRQDSTGDLSSMPIHMADIGSDNWEQDFTLGLIANEQQLVREIDDALERIEDLSYGVCVMTHKPISIARLRAKPWAKFCIDYARQRETGRY